MFLGKISRSIERLCPFSSLEKLLWLLSECIFWEMCLFCPRPSKTGEITVGFCAVRADSKWFFVGRQLYVENQLYIGILNGDLKSKKLCKGCFKDGQVTVLWRLESSKFSEVLDLELNISHLSQCLKFFLLKWYSAELSCSYSSNRVSLLNGKLNLILIILDVN